MNLSVKTWGRSQKNVRTFLVLALLVLAFSLALIDSNKVLAFPTYTPNSDNVTVGPYDVAAAGAGNLGYNNGVGTRELITVGQSYRIRQNGTLTQVKLYTSDISNATGLYIKIWRLNGNSRYDVVGTTENLISSVATNTMNTITLATPITGVQEGDYYGYRVEKSAVSAGQMFFARTGQSNVTSYMVDNASPGNNYNWTALTALAGTTTPIQLFMQAPQFVFIGDSIIAGHGLHYSFLENSAATTNITSTIEKQFSLTTGYTYQNMGIGGQNTTQISARFTADVVNLKPRVVVIEGGVNDLAQSVTKATFIANWTSMLNAAQANNIQVMILKILPWGAGTNTQLQTRDDWNSSLATLAATYPNTVVVDASSLVGLFRAGGDAGNLWDIKTALTPDQVHYFQSGHTLIAQALSDTLADASAPTITSVTSTTASGSYKAGTAANVTINFSEAVTSTGPVTVTLNTTPTPRTCTFTVANSTSASCSYTIQPTDTSAGLSTSSISGTIADFVGNAMSNFAPVSNLTASKTIIIDTTAPTINSVTTSKSSGAYTAGNTIDLTVGFSESVSSSGTVAVTLNTTPTARSCTFTVTTASSGNCDYIVAATDTASALNTTLIAGTITDTAGNAVSNFTPTSNLTASKAIVIDTTAPTITSITSATANGSYGTGAVIDIIVNFSEAITATGSVLVTLNTTPSHTCTFTVVSTTSASCNYTVNSGDSSSSLLVSSIAGTIVDLSANTMTNLVPAANLSSSKSIIVDTVSPAISQITATTTSNSVAITWVSDELSSSMLDYGLSSTYSNSTSETDVSTKVISHSVSLDSLVPCSLYHYRVKSKDAAGNETADSDNTFLTTGCSGSSSISSQSGANITISTGGSLSLLANSLGVSLTVPSGFSASDAYFQIKKLDPTSVSNAISSPSGYSIVDTFIYDIKALSSTTSSVTSFNSAITITIAYSTTSISGLNESSLRIYRFDGSQWQQLSNCTVDAPANSVSCTTTAFSVFGLYGQTSTTPASTSSTSLTQSIIVKSLLRTTAVTPTSSTSSADNQGVNTTLNESMITPAVTTAIATEEPKSTQETNDKINYTWPLIILGLILVIMLAIRTKFIRK